MLNCGKIEASHERTRSEHFTSSAVADTSQVVCSKLQIRADDRVSHCDGRPIVAVVREGDLCVESQCVKTIAVLCFPDKCSREKNIFFVRIETSLQNTHTRSRKRPPTTLT